MCLTVDNVSTSYKLEDTEHTKKKWELVDDEGDSRDSDGGRFSDSHQLVGRTRSVTLHHIIHISFLVEVLSSRFYGTSKMKMPSLSFKFFKLAHRVK